MGPAAQAVIDIDVEGEAAEADLKNVSKAIEMFAERAEQAMYAVGAVVAVDQIKDLASEMLGVFGEADRAVKRLDTTLKTTGNTTGLTSDQLAGMRNELSDYAGTAVDELAAVQNIFARTRSMSGDIFIDATKTAMDFAAAMEMDVKGAAEELSEAMMDPANELEKFRRFGIVFSDQEKEMLNQMQSTGKGMEAQRYVLEKLNAVVGGQARAQFESFSGQQEALGNKVKRLQASLGGMLANAIEPLYPAVGRVVDVCIAWLPVLEEIAIGATNGVTSLLSWVPTLEETSGAIAGWAATVQSIFENWDKYIAMALLNAGANVVGFATDIQHYFTDSIPTYAKTLFIVMKDVFFQLDDIISTVVSNISKNIQDFWGALKAVMNGEMPSFTPTSLLEGFELKLSELPKHTAKQMSETEKVMRQAAADLSVELGADIVTKTEVKVKEQQEKEKNQEIQDDLPEKALTLGSGPPTDSDTSGVAGTTVGLTELADQIGEASAQEKKLDNIFGAQTKTNELLANSKPPTVDVQVQPPKPDDTLAENVKLVADAVQKSQQQIDLTNAVQNVVSQQRDTKEAIIRSADKQQLNVNVNVTQTDVVNAIDRSTAAIVAATNSVGRFK